MKPLSEFYQNQTRWCKSCRSDYERVCYQTNAAHREQAKAATKRWRKEHPGYHRQRYQEQNGYEKHLIRKFGITQQQYNQMLARQDFRCAICGDDGVDFGVDHNHRTNKIRGLLCSNCNHGIGLLKDNPAVLLCAARYVS